MTSKYFIDFGDSLKSVLLRTIYNGSDLVPEGNNKIKKVIRMLWGSTHKIALVGAVLTLSGCFTLSGHGDLALADVKHTNSVIHYPGTGGMIISSSRNTDNNSLKAVCVAPPAQSAQTEAIKTLTSISAAASAKANAPEGTSGEVTTNFDATRAYEATTAVTRLFEQNERTLLLQYSLYRLCEAHMNGMFDAYENPALEIFKIQEADKNTSIGSLAEARLKKLVDVESEIEKLLGERDKATTPANKQAKEDKIHQLKSIYFKNAYRDAFNFILDKAVELAKIDQQRAASEAEKAKAENCVSAKVTTAQNRAEKAEAAADLAEKKLEQMKDKVIDGTLACVNCKREISTSMTNK